MKWFKHDTDAHTDLKIQGLIRKHGVEAYGLYWVCNELISRENDRTFRIISGKDWKVYVMNQTGIDAEKLEKLLKGLGEFGLIDGKSLKQGTLCNPKLQSRCDEYTKRVRRMSEHSTDNVPLEENRIEEKRIDKNRKDILAIKNNLKSKFSIPNK